MGDCCRRSIAWWLLVAPALGLCEERAHSHVRSPEHSASELVFFLSAEGHRLSDSASGITPHEDASPAADIVLAIKRGKFRLFGEYLLSPRDHEMERLQVGYEPVADTVIWIGRFHQPASAWNTQHHHGRYLQTTITRPAIELWEDESGVLPQHLAGLFVDSRQSISDSAGLHIAAGAGLGSTLGADGLQPMDVLKPRQAGRHMSWTGRLAYLPDYIGATSFGVVFGHHHMSVDDEASAKLLARTARQTVWGVFADWHHDSWRVMAVGYDVKTVLDGLDISRTERFSAGYLQAERNLTAAFTVYGRSESSHRVRESLYVSAFHPGFELHRLTAGLRWDFRSRQAITLEVARGETLAARQTETRLQWSSALP
jgi:hypothetical protein